MVLVDIHQLIAALNPVVYCEAGTRREVRKILKAGRAQRDEQAFLTAAANAQVVEPNAIDVEHLELENPFRLPAFRSPVERHTLMYDSFDESLEAFYFWLLDELQREEWTVSKLVDTFLATPGPGLFSELGRRQSRAQQDALKLLRDAHALIQEILRQAPDFKRKERSEEEPLAAQDSRAQVERDLLRSKTETLKLYARWLGPYLRQARQLEPNARGDAGLVSLFNTAAVEVTLLAQREYPVEEDVDRGDLPRMFLKANRRAYFSVLIIELKLRAAPERTSAGAYGYRGRFGLTMTSYALNEEELAVLREELDRENLSEVLTSVGGKAGESLNQILKQMESLAAEPVKAGAKPDDPNPFLALLGLEDRRLEQEKKNADDTVEVPWWSVKPDSDIEAVIRSQAILDARQRCLEFYNACKAALKMARF